MRDLYLMLGMAAVAVVIGLLLFFFGPSSIRSDISNAFSPGSTNVQSRIGFTVVQRGDLAASITERSNYRITSQDDLVTLWTLIYGDNRGPQIPGIDFSKYEVLAVFDGTHASDGYQVSVKKVADQNAIRTITIVHSVPSSRCRIKNTQTSPFELIQVPKTAFSLAHADETGTTTCAY